MIVKAGSTDVTTYFHLRLAADGTDATGLTITNIDLQYVRSGVAPVAKVDATALAATDSAHGDNQAIEIDATDQPGVYRVDWPDAAFAAGVREVILTVKCATAFTESLRVQLQQVPADVTHWLGTAAATPTTAGVPEVDVTHWLGTAAATPTVAGVPEVDVTHFGGTAATTSSGRPEVNTSHIGGTLQTANDVGADVNEILTDTGTTLQAELDGIQADTEDIQSKIGAPAVTLAADIADVEGKVDDLETRLGTPSDLGSGATVAANLVDIEAQTDDIGVAGAGLTAINLPDQTMNITGNITGNLSGSVGSVAAGGITAASIATDAIDADALAADAIAEINATVDTALADIHLDHLLAATYDPASKPGAADALLNELVESDAGVSRFTANALEEAPTGGSAPTAAEIADAVWEEAIADHSGTAGSTAEQLAAAGAAGDPWATPLPGAYTSGQAGKIVGDNLNATVSSRATQTSVDDLPTNAELATALGTADDAVLAAIAALNDLDAAGIRTAVGLASANLDTQLGDLPTNAELTSALAAADDAVLAAIAALNDLDAAGVRTAVGLASANLDTQLGDLPTNSELTTALAAADDAVLAAIAALNNLSAAQVNAQVVDALATDTYAEPAAVPAATATLASKINWLAALARNRVTQTATTQTLRNDGNAADIATASVSDDATTFVRDKWQ